MPLFLVGLLGSLLVINLSPTVLTLWGSPRPRTIGFVGNYTLSTLPLAVQEEISHGLTALTPEGLASPSAAVSWEATDSGKTVIFRLNTNLRWQDGTPFTSPQVNYNLKGVEVERPDAATIKFLLKEPFSPLPVLLSQPLFKTGLIGLGTYRVASVSFTGRFISAITLQNLTTSKLKIYKFYATPDMAEDALRLGSVSELHNVYSPDGFDTDPYYKVTASVDYTTLVGLFFNTQESLLEDKTVRQALAYALPDDFSEGMRAVSPISKTSWAFNPDSKKYPQNADLAKQLLTREATQSAGIKLFLATPKNLQSTAETVIAAWKQIGVTAEMTTADILPESFDAVLAYIDLPPDPDQYSLWHSTQTGNISRYKSPKIDKLLEEGRRTWDQAERQETYFAFQKAITEDVPAVFLFHPKLYTIKRK